MLPWEYEEQLNLLGRYLDFKQNFVSDLEREIRKITVEILPDQKVSGEFAERLKRVVDKLFDIWISEFLRD